MFAKRLQALFAWITLSMPSVQTESEECLGQCAALYMNLLLLAIDTETSVLLSYYSRYIRLTLIGVEPEHPQT